MARRPRPLTPLAPAPELRKAKPRPWLRLTDTERNRLQRRVDEFLVYAMIRRERSSFDAVTE